MPQKKAPQSYPGLTPPVFHILLALADGERHGYAIGQDVAVQADGRLDLGPGTLHGCLKRMLAAALVEESDVRPDPALDDERRRYYRLTRLGRRTLEAEVARLAQAVSAARSRKRVLASGVSAKWLYIAPPWSTRPEDPRLLGAN